MVKYYDCSVVWGYRKQQDQDSAYAKGYSKLKYPNSKHNKLPSLAVDVVPYPTGWKDEKELIRFGQFVKWFANVLFENKLIGNKIYWGGDWKQFIDYAHWEISKDRQPTPVIKHSAMDELGG